MRFLLRPDGSAYYVYTESDEEPPYTICERKWFNDTAAKEKWIACDHCHAWMHYQCRDQEEAEEELLLPKM